MPTMPQYAAGRQIEPIVWLPSATGQRPAATAAADPLLEPPGVRPGAAGLRVGPGAKYAISVVTVLPTTIAPAATSRVTAVACVPAKDPGGSEVPARVGKPCRWKMSFRPTGRPN